MPTIIDIKSDTITDTIVLLKGKGTADDGTVIKKCIVSFIQDNPAYATDSIQELTEAAVLSETEHEIISYDCYILDFKFGNITVKSSADNGSCYTATILKLKLYREKDIIILFKETISYEAIACVFLDIRLQLNDTPNLSNEEIKSEFEDDLDEIYVKGGVTSIPFNHLIFLM